LTWPARWQAASNCIVPRTFISLTIVLDAGLDGLAVAEACTTVSMSDPPISREMSGPRMSTRTNSAAPIRLRESASGSAASTPITLLTSGRAASRPASDEPRNRVTPVTKIVEAGNVTLPSRISALRPPVCLPDAVG